MKDNFGVINGITDGIQIGIFLVQDIACLAAVGVPAYLLGQTGFPPSEGGMSINFEILAAIFAFYLDWHSISNPGKRNYQIIWMLLRDHRPTAYKSLGYYDFHRTSRLRKDQVHVNS